MAVVPNTFSAGATIVAADLNANFSALETAITGNLTETSLSASTRLPNSKLANDDFTFGVDLQFRTGAGGSAWIATPSTVNAVAGLAYDATEGVTAYSIIGATYAARQSTAAVPNFRVEWGYYNGAVWTVTTTVVNNTNLPNGTSAGGTLTLAASSISTHATNVNHLAIVAGNSGTAGFATAGDYLTVHLKLKRALRS